MRALVAVLLLWPVVATAGPFTAPAQAPAPNPSDVPSELEGIDIQDRSGNTVPGDIALVDEAGRPVQLQEYLGRGKPLLVQLAYFQCPMLCTLVLNGYVTGAKGLDWSPGRDYEVLTVSFDPRDTPDLAAKKKATYVASLGKPGSEAGWHFLTGDSAQVRRLADALGFRYRWVPERNEFAHAAGLFALTPAGRISRTLYGIEFSPKDLRLALLEAGEGKLGSPMDKLILYCFQYDAKTHKYALVALNVMKVAGLLTMLVLGGFLVVQWSRERHRPRHAV
jgi:protein SCO1